MPWICPECGYENDSYLIRCFACGFVDIGDNSHGQDDKVDFSVNKQDIIIIIFLICASVIAPFISSLIKELPEYFSSYDFFQDAIFLFFGWLVLDSFRKEKLSYESQFWPVTHGNLIYAYVEKRNTGYPTFGSAYVPLARYEYSVDSKTYASERISFTPIGCYSREDAYRELSFLDNNDTLKVYYKRNNPKISVLKPGFGKANYNIYIIGLTLYLCLYFLCKFYLILVG